MYGERRKSFAPIKAGEEVDVTIESVGAQGDGVAKVKGFVIFVPGTKQGEKVKVKVTKVDSLSEWGQRDINKKQACFWGSTISNNGRIKYFDNPH